MDGRFGLIDRELAFECDRLTVEMHRVSMPDGRVVDDWPFVISQDAVLVVPRCDRRGILAIPQLKYAIGKWCLGPVGGAINPGETCLDAAKRELLEETGLEADDWVKVQSFVAEPNRGVQKIHLFFAQSLKGDWAHAAQPDIEQGVPIWLARHELEEVVKSEVVVSSWALAFLLAIHAPATDANPKSS